MAETKIEERTQAEVNVTALLGLLDKLCEEIATFRRRQILSFRETIIAQALITWAVRRLDLIGGAAILASWSAGLLCLFLGLVGFCVFHIYRKRIYFARDQREILVRQLAGKQAASEYGCTLFYPSKCSDLGERPKQYYTIPSGLLYGWTLIVTGLVTLIVNLAGVVLFTPVHS